MNSKTSDVKTRVRPDEIVASSVGKGQTVKSKKEATQKLVEDSSSDDDSIFEGYHEKLDDSSTESDDLSERFSDDQKLEEYYEKKLLEYSTLSHIEDSATDSSESHVPDSFKELIYDNCQARKNQRASEKLVPTPQTHPAHKSHTTKRATGEKNKKDACSKRLDSKLKSKLTVNDRK